MGQSMRLGYPVKALCFVIACAVAGWGVERLLDLLLPDPGRDLLEERLDQARDERAGAGAETDGDQVAEEHGAVGVEGDLESGAREE